MSRLQGIAPLRALQVLQFTGRHNASFSVSSQRRLNSTEVDPNAEPEKLPMTDPRWLSNIQARIQRLQGMKLPNQNGEKIARMDRQITKTWRELLIGREGFILNDEWKGLDRHQVAWGDMDSMGHVNNVIYNRYAESARVNLIQRRASHGSHQHRAGWAQLMTPKGLGLIMRSIRTDYKFPIQCPDKVSVYHKLVKEPDYDSDTILLEAVILSDKQRRPAARCFEDIVVYDYKHAKKAPLAPFMVDELRKAFKQQESSAREQELIAKTLVDVLEDVERKGPVVV